MSTFESLRTTETLDCFRRDSGLLNVNHASRITTTTEGFSTGGISVIERRFFQHGHHDFVWLHSQSLVVSHSFRPHYYATHSTTTIRRPAEISNSKHILSKRRPYIFNAPPERKTPTSNQGSEPFLIQGKKERAQTTRHNQRPSTPINPLQRRTVAHDIEIPDFTSWTPSDMTRTIRVVSRTFLTKVYKTKPVGAMDRLARTPCQHVGKIPPVSAD